MRLFLHEPTVVFAARCNQSVFQYPLSEVIYDGVTVGSYTDIGNSQTILFGSTAGASDLGSSRVRLTPTATILYFGLSSQGIHPGEANLADNIYITILDQLLVWSKVPYIAPDGTIYMDGSLYVDQNTNSAPVSNAGPPHAATIDPGTGLITVALSGANSFATADGATITGYLWNVKDGAFTVGTSASQDVTITLPAGFRYVRLTVTDSNSKSHNAYVPILAIDPDDDPTIEAFQITRHTITAQGQDLDIRLLEDVDTATFPGGGFLLIMDGLPIDPSDTTNVLFWGWGDTEDLDIAGEETGLLKDTTIHCVDVAGRLKQLPGYSQVLTHAASPTKWSEAYFPHLDFFIWWVAYQQSTALALADFTWSGTSTAYNFIQLFADGSNLWDQLDRLAKAMLPDWRLTANRQGQIKVLPDPLIAQTGLRPLTSQANLSIDDWQALSVTQYRNPRVAWLRFNAIQVGYAIPPVAMYSISPGTSPGQGEGQILDNESLAVSQATLNAAAGHHYARLNAPEGMYTVTLPVSDNDAYDPARMDWVALTITPQVAAQRGLTFSEARFLLHQLDIRYRYDKSGVTKTNTLKLERETVGIPAVTIVPDPVADVDDGDYNTPPAAEPLPGFDGGLSATPAKIALVTDDGRTIRTANFGSSPPTWTVNNAAQASISGSGLSFVVNPFSPLYRTGTGTVDGFYVTTSRIYKLTDLFGTTTATSLHTFAESITTSGGRWRSIACSFGRYEAVEADNPWIMAASAYNSGITTRQGLYIIYSRDGGATWSSEIQVSTFKPTGSFSARYWPVIWMSPRTPGYAIVIAKTQTGTLGGTGAFYTTDWGATWAAMTSLVTSPQVTDGGLAGGGLHVPWAGNADESVIYHGYEVEESAKWERYLRRNTAGVAVDVTPAAGNYGPRWGLFGIRSFDGDRNYLCLAGAKSNADDDILTESAGAFLSSDAGATWTQVLGPTTTAANAQYVAQAAFSGTDHNAVYFFGNEALIYFTSNFGATMENKRGSLSFSGGEEILGLVGGDA